MAGNSTYGAKGTSENYSGQRGNVSSKSNKGGYSGGDMFFKDRTMQNTEGVGKNLNISRRQPS